MNILILLKLYQQNVTICRVLWSLLTPSVGLPGYGQHIPTTMPLQLPLLLSLSLQNINIQSSTSFFVAPLPLHFFYSLISSQFSLRSFLFGVFNDACQAIFCTFKQPIYHEYLAIFSFSILNFFISSIKNFTPFLLGAFICSILRPILPSYLPFMHVSWFCLLL